MTSDASHVLLEVCIGSVADAAAATAAGADRLELCSALELGGLSPSPGLLESVVEASELPVMAMLRPRAGGFCYDEHEFAAMLRDVESLLAAGAQGVVFGVLDEHGRVDVDRCRKLAAAAGDAQVVFHRAFDFTPDLAEALEQLVDVGVTRVLTSGGAATAFGGAAVLADLVRKAAGRIEILPGGGVRPAQVRELVERSGANQLHVGASTQRIDHSTEQRHEFVLNDLAKLADGGHRVVDAGLVAEFVRSISATDSASED